LRDSYTFEADSDIRALGVSRERAWALTGLAMLGLAVTLVHRQALAALAVTVSTSLSISDVAYGWLSSAFASAYLVGSIPGARFMQQFGPRVGLAATLVLTSIAIGLHGFVSSYWTLLALRICLGLAVAPAFACATHTVHRVLPFKDRARGIGLLYMGNSLGSAVCPPLAVMLASAFNWRNAFIGVAIVGILWVPAWILAAFTGAARKRLDKFSEAPPPMHRAKLPSLSEEAKEFAQRVTNPALFRGCFVVAAAAPITTIMLLWGTKYLVSDHGLTQAQTGHYLWLPALLFGSGSMLFGELRSRSVRTRANVRPPRALMAIATALALLMAAVPFGRGPLMCVLICSLAMCGAGGLYTLATSDMLAFAPRGSVPATTGLTTLTQSLVYIIVSPILGKVVELSGNYRWVMMGAGLWVLPGCLFWLLHATLQKNAKKKRPAVA
jgi:ACS family hexuronate transporter-like MFS transporter